MAFSLMATCPLFSQITEITPADQPPFSPETLIRNFFIGEGVQILDIKYDGDLEATGLFTKGLSDIGIEQGIVLGTGEVKKIEGASSSESSTSTSNLDVRDEKLEEIIGADVLKDVAAYEITFIPSADSIQFNYVFASEEYPEFVCSVFNDVFGFFITGPNPAGGNYDLQNLAIVPGTSNLPVSINNVNPGMVGTSGTVENCENLANLDFANFYNSNESDNLVFDGILEPFIAAAKVIPCETYTIRFSIADAVDFLKDSAVFLEGKSFSSNALEVKAKTISANGTITEGCAEATLVFELPANANSNQDISFEVIGTAQNGVDIEMIESGVVIPFGQSTAEVQIVPIEDNIEEGIESLGIVVSLGTCSRDTLWLGIEDNLLAPPDVQGPIFLCGEPEVQIDFSIPFDPPSPVIFRNQNETRIEPVDTPVFSNIEVENIFPSTLNQTDFIQVCIDELTHPWIGDISIFLFGPDNQFVELTGNNGGNGGNGTGLDFLLNTCFTLDASEMISAPTAAPPYVGSFLPEGDWNDLLGSSSYKVNGTWRLMMLDNFVGSVGTLSSWSIHFGRTYDINYSWSPDVDISCTDCPDPIFSPSESRTYTLTVDDSNGCSLQHEVVVEANAANIGNPILECNNEVDGELSVSWNAVPGASTYQIRIDGSEWIDLMEELSFTASNQNPGASVLFEVQALGSCGNSEIVSTTCNSAGCATSIEVISFQNPDCNSPNGGIISVQAINGTAPFTYQFGDITNDTGLFENLIGGEHLITVFDANDCQSQILVPLISIEEIIIEGDVVMATCMENNGKIEFTISGGTGELNLEWSANFQGNLEALLPGIYTLEVTDEAGCIAVKDFIIEEQVNFEVTTVIEQPNCLGSGLGSINIELNEPSLVDDIVWSNGATGSLNDNLEPGTYSVQIISNEGCEFNQTFEIVASSEIVVDQALGNIFCQGENNGSIALSISGGTEPYDIEWSNGMFGDQLLDLPAGIYSTIITDDNGCVFLDTIALAEPNPLIVENMIVESPTCHINTGRIELLPEGGTPPYLVSLNGESFRDQLTFENLLTGNYLIDIMDSQGCSFSMNEQIVIEPYEEINLMTETNISINFGESLNLQAWVTNKNDNEISYEWASEDTEALSCSICDSPEFTGLRSNRIEVIATDNTNGCTTSRFITIFVDTSAEIYVPNAFSPNGDGVNDRLAVFGDPSLVSSIDEFYVYDRWGNQVSAIDDMLINSQSTGWDGIFRGDQINNGVFVWSLKITFIDGTTKIFSGDVTLVR